MKTNQGIRRVTRFLRINLTWLVLLGFLLLLLFIPRSPYYNPYPERDSSVFIYTAERVLDHQVPYRDVWDHKGPLIYFIDAAGLLLTPGSQWGIWWLQVLSLGIALVLGFVALYQYFDKRAALMAILVGFSIHGLLFGGNNFTEEYSILPIMIAFYLFTRYLRATNKIPLIAAIGVCFGVAFFLRPNNIGFFLAIAAVVGLQAFKAKAIKQGLVALGTIAGGFILVALAIAAYFGLNHALGDFYDQVFLYNLFYAAEFASFKAAFLIGLERTQFLFLLYLVAFTLLTADVIQHRKWEKPRTYFLTLILASLPFEIFFAGLSGRGFAHYYLTWLPGISFLLAYLFQRLIVWSDAYEGPTGKQRVSSAELILLAFYAGTLLLPLRVNLQATANFFTKSVTEPNAPQATEHPEINAVVDYFESHAETRDNPYLLVWGNEVVLNLATHKLAPTKFVYQYPLYNPSYIRKAMIEEYRDSIEETHPLILVVNEIPWIDKPIWNQIPGMDQVIDYINANYTYVTEIEPGGYSLYVYQAQDK